MRRREFAGARRAARTRTVRRCAPPVGRTDTRRPTRVAERAALC